MICVFLFLFLLLLLLFQLSTFIHFTSNLFIFLYLSLNKLTPMPKLPLTSPAILNNKRMLQQLLQGRSISSVLDTALINKIPEISDNGVSLYPLGPQCHHLAT